MAENVSLIRYTRVSKADGSQLHHLRQDALLAAGVAPTRLYQDSISGARDSRPGLDTCLAAFAPGDTLVIRKLGRLVRSLRHLVNIIGVLSALRLPMAATVTRSARGRASSLPRVR